MLQEKIKIIDKAISKYEKKAYDYLAKPQTLVDQVYKYILYIASGIIVYELFTHLYTFSRAIWIFMIFTGLYMYHKYKSSQVSGYKNKISFFKKIYTYIKTNRDILFGLCFVLYFIIFMTGLWFNTDTLLIQYTLFLFLMYIIYKLLGGRFNYEVKKQAFFSITFLQTLIIFTAISYASVFRIADIFGIGIYKNYIIWSVIGVGCIAFTLLFSNLFTTIQSRKTKMKLRKYFYGLLVNNLRLILTGSIFLGVGIWILYNNGLLDMTKQYVFTGKSVEVIEPSNNIPELPQIEVPIETETFIIGDRYSFAGGIQEGSVSDEVVVLKGYLRDLEYYYGDDDRVFNSELKQSLTDALIENCGWPQTTRGILGPQAIECIESLEITREIEQIEEVSPDKVQQLISNEA